MNVMMCQLIFQIMEMNCERRRSLRLAYYAMNDAATIIILTVLLSLLKNDPIDADVNVTSVRLTLLSSRQLIGTRSLA